MHGPVFDVRRSVQFFPFKYHRRNRMKGAPVYSAHRSEALFSDGLLEDERRSAVAAQYLRNPLNPQPLIYHLTNSRE